MQKAVDAKLSGSAPPSLLQHVAQYYQTQKLLIVHGHSSMPEGKDIACNEIALLSYTQPGVVVWSSETRKAMQALNTGGALLTKVPGKGDLSLKMNSDASPNYSYNFHCHNGYEEQTTFTLGYYIFDPTAASGEHLEYLPSSKTTLVYPGTSKTDLAFAQGIAKHHNIDTILAFGCKSGAMVDTKEFGSPVPQTDSVWVCGAGCELANGEYHLDGEFKGKPMFTSSDSGLQLWFNDGEWRIGRSCDYYYVSSDEHPTGVWQVATFRANEATKSPAPSVAP